MAELIKEKHLTKCYRCGCFINTLFKTDKVYDFFLEEYISKDNLWLFEEARDLALNNIVKLLKKYSPNPKSMLDIGSATGRLFEFYDIRNISKVTVVEPSKFGCERIKRKYPSVEVISKPIEEVDIKPNSYELITILDTLYFCFSPYIVLKKVYSGLSKNGLLLIEVANFNWQRITRKIGKYYYTNYTRDSLIKVLDLHGFKVIGNDSNIGNIPSFGRKLLHLTIFNFTKALYFLSSKKIDIVPKIIVIATK